jgi:hypothetical protein
MPDFYKFSPGDQAKLWSSMLRSQIASIGWWNHNYTNKGPEEIALTNPELGSGSVRIIYLFNQLSPGDILLAFKGRQNIIGYGVVKSSQKYSPDVLHLGSIHHNYVEIEWHPLAKPFKTDSYFAIDTLSKVTDRYDEFSAIFSDNAAVSQLVQSAPVVTHKHSAPASPPVVETIVAPVEKKSSDYKIFISYRRDDEARYLVPTIAEKLNQRYGLGTAFYDVDNIPLGVDFREYLKSAIDKSYIVLVVMGKDWFGQAPDGSRRIDRPNDFVRIEVESALAMGKIVIPVLTGSATMPQESDLPESIASLAFRNGTKISSGADYNSHFNSLLSAIDPLLNYSS